MGMVEMEVVLVMVDVVDDSTTRGDNGRWWRWLAAVVMENVKMVDSSVATAVNSGGEGTCDQCYGGSSGGYGGVVMA